ncbi:MAG: SPOR domain-containing protein [Muribaculaceae bacterium]|nr:SPOR domain-containing protein [Muribaculaceae bacterium]
MRISESIKTLRAAAIVIFFTAATGAEFMTNANEPQPSDSVISITAEINAAGHVRVSQPEALTARVSSRKTVSEESTVTGEMPGDASKVETAASRRHASAVRTGYRIQVFDDNNPRTARQSASSVKSRIEGAFPAYRAYVTFNSPYWRVKAGDFRSRAEAESAMAEIKKAFPELKAYIRIVRDRVNIYD